MNEPKPIASLSPGLLARKGAARPAMRPQLQPLNFDTDGNIAFGSQLRHQIESQDDLGWNDMGHEPEAFDAVGDQPSTVVSVPFAGLTPVGASSPVVPIAGNDPVETPLVAAASPALAQLEALAATMAAAPAAKASGNRRSALKEGRKAAFTLRLDAERHLRLRLACTMQNRSAQQFVVDALERALESLPGLDEIARRVQRP